MRIQKDAMDRTVLAACALALAPVVLGAGCDAEPKPVPKEHAPLVLAELQRVSPGPWRRADAAIVAPTSLEQPIENSFAPPTALDPADLGDLQSRMRNEGRDTQQDPAIPPYDDRVSEPRAAGSDAGSWRQGPRPQPVTPAVPGAPEASDQSSNDPIGVPRILTPPAAPRPVTGQRLPGTNASSSTEQTPLPWADRRPLTPEMQAVLDQAELRVRQGFRLAQRNALFLAREELTDALELIAQANDIQSGTQFYTNSLDAGLTALAESRDFLRPRPVGKRLDLARIISGHRTPILKDESLDGLAPAMAARRYYAYAQEQLAGAAAGEPRSSIALYGLAKSITVTGANNASERMESTARAMVLYQAALMADRGNYRAANELGVILANNGDLPHARDLLAHSVRLSRHPVPYRNLAVVLSKLGEPQLAQRAIGEAVALEQTGRFTVGPAVRWVDPVTFAGMAPTSDAVLPPVAAGRQMAKQTGTEPQQAPVKTARGGISDWLPWTRR